MLYLTKQFIKNRLKVSDVSKKTIQIISLLLIIKSWFQLVSGHLCLQMGGFFGSLSRNGKSQTGANTTINMMSLNAFLAIHFFELFKHVSPCVMNTSA